MHQKDSNENSPLLIAIDFLLDLKIKPTFFYYGTTKFNNVKGSANNNGVESLINYDDGVFKNQYQNNFQRQCLTLI